MNDNEFLNLDFTDIKFDPNLSRRELLKALGGGIIIFFCVGDSSVLEAQRRGGGRGNLPDDFNAFLRIGENGRVTCFTGKIEKGQGIITSLAQMLADEIDVSLESVDMVMGDTSVCPWDMGTFGSMSTRFFGPPLRAAGAEARRVLLELAAEQLKVPQERLVAENGVIFDQQQKDKCVTYGDLAKGKTIARRAKEKPSLKKPSEFKVMNKSFLRRDSVEKVTGKAQYAGDIRLPGMLYAKLLRPPAHGAKLKKVDTSAAEKIEGVTVVHEGDLVAVLHKNPDQAAEALSKIQAEFDPSPSKVDDQNIFDHLLKNAGKGEPRRTGRRPRRGTEARGDHRGADVPRRLQGPFGDGDPYGPRPSRRQQGHGLDLHPDALPDERPDRQGPRLPRGQRAGHHALCRRWVRRQERRPAVHRGRPAGQGDRQTRPGMLEPGGGVLL